jgi:hypothetical protein
MSGSVDAAKRGHRQPQAGPKARKKKSKKGGGPDMTSTKGKNPKVTIHHSKTHQSGLGKSRRLMLLWYGPWNALWWIWMV